MQEIIQKLKKEIDPPELVDKTVATLRSNLKETNPFFLHSLRMALILTRMGADQKTLLAGILHHIDPDKIADEQIKAIIKKANQLKDLCSPKKSSKAKPLKKWRKVYISQQAEALRRMFFAITRDISPILITLAGRLDEMNNLAQEYPPEEQIKRSIIALEILSPLAYGLGMGGIKGDLEDAAFPYVYPKEYQWLQKNVKEEYNQRAAFLNKIKPALEKILADHNIKVIKISARAKHSFSLYQKLLKYNMDFDKIYDLIAFRVILQDVESCYQALGIIHNTWSPLYGRIKDYISSPKPNGYRSLHTTVQCPICQDPIEIQIKTLKMNQEAAYGAAAHFSYKEKLPEKTYQHQFYWLDQLRKWQAEIKDPQKISEHLQTDLFKDSIFTLTPKMEVIDLPKGSTPIDFAYAVHSEIGEHCVGAKVNNKMVSLKQSLKTGDQVEIITAKDKKPTSDWLRVARTQKARSKIRNFLEKAYGLSLAKPGRVIKEKASLITKIIPRRTKKESKILIGGQAGIAVKMAKCCQPKQGENIIAFVTKGEGASVHKTNCSNLAVLQQKQPQRIVEASWTKG